MGRSRITAVRGLILMLGIVLPLVVGPLEAIPIVAPAVALAEVPGFGTVRPVGPGSDLVASSAVGDMDGDGDLDLVIGKENIGSARGQLGEVYLNDGSANFPTQASYTFGGPQDVTQALAIGDLDSDGDLDLVAGNNGQPNVVYHNDGSGQLTPAATLSTAGKQTRALALGDLDSDGDLDLVVGNSFQLSTIHFNDGSGQFPVEATYGWPIATSTVAVADIDSDGRLDIVTGTLGQWNVIYFNLASVTGTALFHTGPIDCSQTPGVYCFGTGNDVTLDLSIGDMNGDQRPDIVVGNHGQNAVYLATGFRAVVYGSYVGLPGEATNAIASGDLDNDGDSDILSGNQNGPAFLYLNNGQGGFPTVVSLDSVSNGATTKTADIADMNGDGRLDIFIGNSLQQSSVYLSDHGGSLVSREHVGRGGDLAGSIITADLDSDGRREIVVGNDGQENLIFRRTPGGFDSGAGFGTGFDATSGLAASDVNRDGHTDLVVANYEQQSLVYLNDGQGGFQRGTTLCGVSPTVRCFGSSSGATKDIAAGDLNADGYADLVVGQLGQGFILINDRTGNFFDARPFGTATGSPGRVLVEDMNSDGAPDIIAGQMGQSFIYLNDRSGNFPFSSARPFGYNSTYIPPIAVADLNRDGAPDIVSGIAGLVSTHFNDGSGAIVAETPLLVANNVLALAVGDLNGDTNPDVVFAADGVATSVLVNAGNGTFPIRQALDTGGNIIRAIRIDDVSGDGVNDLLFGLDSGQEFALINNGTGAFPARLALGPEPDTIFSVALADMDDDGDLDVIGGQANQPSSIFLNDGRGRFPPEERRVFSSVSGQISSVAVGDLDNDARLDIVASYMDQPNHVFLNRGGTYSAAPLSPTASSTTDVALGDVDGDSDLDLVVVNRGQPALIYLNAGNGTFPTQRSFGPTDDGAEAVAFGDLNDDNALDIVVANGRGQPNRVYVNDGRGHFPTALPFGSAPEVGYRLAIGDIDSDNDLDVVVGNVGSPSAVYLNDGTGSLVAGQLLVARSAIASPTGLTLADLNGDTHLDIVIAKYGQTNDAYLNDGTGRFSTSWSFGRMGGSYTGLAAGDLDADGDSDLVLAGFLQPTEVYRNGLAGAAALPDNPPTVQIQYPGPGPAADGFAGATRISQQIIPITYRLADREGNAVRTIRASYSLNGGGVWREAVPTAATDTTDLAAAPEGTEHVFAWDTFASGFFGQSDSVIFRIEAFPDVRSTRGGVASNGQRPSVTARTYPFRVRGTQVRVVQEGGPLAPPPASEPVQGPYALRLPLVSHMTNRPGQVSLGALVYRWRDGQAEAQPIARDASRAYQTAYRSDSQGYLQGRGTLLIGDRLVALQPIAATETYTMYFTSGRPTLTGIDSPVRGVSGQQYGAVSEPGVQTLSVSPSNPLILFNLKVSLEWDARNDPRYVQQLSADLRRASAVLYDWTDGQIALGDVTIYQDRQEWDNADIRVYASNRLRPHANQGGIVVVEEADPAAPRAVYQPGSVSMGATWNRYGEAVGTVGDDWPRTLAHELGHYLLFLNEDYLKLENGVLSPVESCPSAMSDPYLDNTSELRPQSDWLPGCAQTLSHLSVQRSDWETIKAFYDRPELNFRLIQPARYNANPGPNNLILGVTQIHVVEPATPPATLRAPIFYLTGESGQGLTTNPSARAILYQTGAGGVRRLIDLGHPAGGQVEARGARAGDELCVYDPADQLLGCQAVTADNQQLQLRKLQGPWQADVAIAPLTPQLIELTVQAPAGQTLTAQLFPSGDPAPAAITLSETSPGVYRGHFPTLAEVTLEGHVRVWAAGESGQRWETVSDFAVGGDPGRARQRRRSSRRSRRAPVLSADGQAIVYGDDSLPKGEFYTLQTTSAIVPPAWATPVGQAYRLTATAGAPQLSGRASISIGYLSGDVEPGEEPWIRVYFWEDGLRDPQARCGTHPAPCWRQLPTILNAEQNTAAATAQGPGLYALFSSIEIPLRTGWNQIAYLVQTRPVREALRSIEGLYTTVYGFDPDSADDPWQIYDVSQPDELNTLRELELGKGYLIYVTGNATLGLRGPLGNNGALGIPTAAAARLAAAPPLPATYYGEVKGEAGLQPRPGLPVLARVGATICGRGMTVLSEGRVLYSVRVASDAHANGCGVPGTLVRFQVGDDVMSTTARWDAGRPAQLDLRK